MSPRSRILSALSAVLAIAAPLFFGIQAHRAQTASPAIRFTVAPYDPRDILYGQYMRFKIDWNWQKDQPAPSAANDQICLCVGDGEIDPPVRWTICPPVKGAPVAECRHILKGQYRGAPVADGEAAAHDFDIGISRYYVDEAVALPLEKLFAAGQEKFLVGLVMRPSGKPVLEKMYISGQSLPDYLAAQGGKIPEISDPAPTP